MNAALLEQEKDWQNKARKILDEIGLVDFLSKFGEPKIVGSLALGLMTWADIDIDVGVSEIEESGYWDSVRHIFANPSVKRLVIADNRRLSDALKAKGIPESLYLGVFAESGGHLWKIDIRFVPVDSSKEISSVDVYQAVLDGMVEDLDGFKEYTRSLKGMVL